MLKKLWRWLDKNPGLVLILLLTIILRIPSLFEPYWYGDEGIYLALGQAVRKGLVLYRDIHDNKPPLLYLIAALAGNVFYFRLILMIWFGVAVGVFFRLMQVLFPKNKAAWYVSTAAMIVLTTMFEGNIANAEIFIVLPVTIGVLLAYQWVKKSTNWWQWLIIGLLFAMGFLFKVPAGFDLVAVLIWLVAFAGLRLTDKRPWLIVIGFLTPVVLSVVYYAYQGAFEPYVRSALMQNIGYLASWKTGEQSASGFTSQSGLVNRGAVLAIVLAGFCFLARRFKLSAGAKLTIVWFLLALFGALLSERPYPHYLIQSAVPAAVLISYFLFGQRKLMKLVVMVVMIVAGWYYYQIRFWHYPVIPYYQNFIEYALGKKSLDKYRSFFDWRVNQIYQVAAYLRTKTLPENRVFIWGDEPYIYALAKRLPPGRYTVAYHVIDFDGYQETMTAWQKHEPKVVIVMAYEKREFPELEAVLKNDYVLVEQIEAALIYRRLDSI